VVLESTVSRVVTEKRAADMPLAGDTVNPAVSSGSKSAHAPGYAYLAQVLGALL